MNCLFCSIQQKRIIDETNHFFIIRDAFPISTGHTLIISKQHILSFFDVSQEEQVDLLKALGIAKKGLDHAQRVDGYNIGINDGVAAGQTVQHLHVHLIPRYLGDQTDPRGGIRRIFPHKANYWATDESNS